MKARKAWENHWSAWVAGTVDALVGCYAELWHIPNDRGGG
jgi:hypothetical protein